MSGKKEENQEIDLLQKQIEKVKKSLEAKDGEHSSTLQKIKDLKDASSRTVTNTPGGQLLVVVQESTGIVFQGAPAPKFHCTVFPKETVKASEFSLFDEGQIAMLRDIARLDFHIRLVPFTKQTETPLFCTIKASDFLDQATADSKWYNLVETRGTSTSTHCSAETKKLLEEFKTVQAIAKAALDKPPLDIQEGDFQKSEAVMDRWLANMRPWWEKHSQLKKKDVPDKKVKTDYGWGTLVGYNPCTDMYEVRLNSWQLANGTHPTCYLQESSISAYQAEKEKPRANIILKYVAPDPNEHELKQETEKLAKIKKERQGLENQRAELVKKLKRFQKQNAKKSNADPAKAAQSADAKKESQGIVAKITWPFQFLYNKRESAITAFWKMKNVLIFVGGVAFMHYRGEDLAV